MRIISKFADYYDSVQAYGADDTIIYIRTEEIFEKFNDLEDFGVLKNLSVQQRSTYGYSYNRAPEWCSCSAISNFGEIVFCGWAYPYIRIQSGYEENYSDHKSFTIYSEAFTLDQATAFLKNYTVKRYKKNWEEKFEKIAKSLPPEDFFTKVASDINLMYKTPIIILNKTIRSYSVDEWRVGDFVIFNGCLKDYEFFRIKDAFSAYMELDMYMSGVLGSVGNPMVSISDKDKIYKHGFDYKYGFRTRKE